MYVLFMLFLLLSIIAFLFSSETMGLHIPRWNINKSYRRVGTIKYSPRLLTFPKASAISKVPTVSMFEAIIGIPRYVLFEFLNVMFLVKSTYKKKNKSKIFLDKATRSHIIGHRYR